MLFYFDILEGGRLIEDGDGIELPDWTYAEREAVRFARGVVAQERLEQIELEVRVRQNGERHHRFSCTVEMKSERLH